MKIFFYRFHNVGNTLAVRSSFPTLSSMMTLNAFPYVTIIIKNALQMLSIIPNQGPMWNNK